jgi:hypothetical protein
MREKLVGLLQSPWFIALVALLLRIAWLVSKIREIPAEVLATVPFQNEVGNVALALSSGHGFCCLFRQPTGPTAWLSPVYPLLIAAIFKIFEPFTFRAFWASVVLNSVTSAAACFPIFYSAHRIARTKTGSSLLGAPPSPLEDGTLAAGGILAPFAAWLWALSPIGIILPYAWIWDSSLSALLAATLLWATLRISESPSFRGNMFYALLWGISLLTNPALGALLPFLLVWVFLRLPLEKVHKARFAVSVAVLILVTCLPWTLRNYFEFHRFIPLRSNFPYEFWSGNNAIFDPDSHEINRITRFEQTRLYAHEGETAFLDEKWLAAKTFIRTHPSLYAKLSAQRIVATWFGTEQPLRDFRSADSALAKFLIVWSALSFAAMLLGLVRLYFGRRELFFPVAVFPVIFPITFYLAHTSLRHRHPLDPILSLLMAIAIVGVKRRA